MSRLVDLARQGDVFAREHLLTTAEFLANLANKVDALEAAGADYLGRLDRGERIGVEELVAEIGLRQFSGSNHM